jgi:hypothetical protein
MGIAIADEHTSLGSKLQFPSIVWMKVWPDDAPKSAEEGVVRFMITKMFDEGFMIDDFRW